MTVTTKKKMSIWAWVLIALALVAIVVAGVLHIVGIIDLSFIGEGFMGYVEWQAADAMNALLGALGWITLGVLGFYVAKTYIWGTQIPTTTYPQAYSAGYNPQPTQPSQPQQEHETEIS